MEATKIHTSVQHSYEIRRTGLNRLSIIIEGYDKPVSSPRLSLRGNTVVLVRDESNRISLPDFPCEYIPELMRGRSVLIGEREPSSEKADASVGFSASHSPVRRFYEASVIVEKSGSETVHTHTLAS